MDNTVVHLNERVPRWTLPIGITQSELLLSMAIDYSDPLFGISIVYVNILEGLSYGLMV